MQPLLRDRSAATNLKKFHTNKAKHRMLTAEENIRLIEIEIEIEIVYNMYRMRRFFTKSRMRRLLSLGPPNYAIHGTYKSLLDR
jgi:hypothetical protein